MPMTWRPLPLSAALVPSGSYIVHKNPALEGEKCLF